MIHLSDYLPDLRHKNKLPTLRERDLEFQLQQIKERLTRLEEWKNRHE